MLNMYSASDAIAEENDVRKQTRVIQSSGKGVHSRYCAKGRRLAKTTASGRFEQMEGEVNVRERRDLQVSIEDPLIEWMREDRRTMKPGEQIVCVVGLEAVLERAADIREAMAVTESPIPVRKPLPTARVFLAKPGKVRRNYLRPAYVFND